MKKSLGESFSLQKARMVYQENVPNVQVAQAYLETELSNTFGENLVSDNGPLRESLAGLNDHQTYRLLEAMSYAYRMNGVFHTITDQSYDWHDVELVPEDIRLTAIKPRINKIIFSDAINQNPVVFGEYLHDYFERYPDPDEDPEGLNEFRVKDSGLQEPKILVGERADGIYVMDGNHRLVVASMIGLATIRAFAGVPNGQESVSMVGDSVFLTLRLRYESAESYDERQAIFNTSALLARSSTDGLDAIKKYWIEHPANKDVIAAGEKIISQFE